MQAGINKNKALVPWICGHYKKGAEVASLCVGAFLLASTGLLDGKRCSTHWGRQNELKEMFPNVEVVDCGIITEENRIYSSGGGNIYWNLLLYLVEKYTNHETAILAAKYFIVDIGIESQAAFAIFRGQKNHADTGIKKAQDFIEKNISQRISIDELASMINISRRSFERRFKLATNNTVQEYIHRVKVEAAKHQFELSSKNINEVMFDVGYTDAKGFRTMFKKITELTPIEYRSKYNKQSVQAVV
jgi:transcriptional regulator GlxA family with amidase domain